MSYIGTEPKDIRSFGRTKFDYTATQGQTAFTGADDDGKVLAFTVGQIEVYVNGILMDDSDFTTTGTGTVTLASAANLNDVINIVSFESNIPDNDYVPASGGTFTGAVTHSGNVTFSGTTSGIDMNGTDLILDADGDSKIEASTDDIITVHTAGSERMRIDTNGKVGIGGGTDAAQGKLDVRGPIVTSNSTSSYWSLDRDDTTGNFTINDSGSNVRTQIDTYGNFAVGGVPAQVLLIIILQPFMLDRLVHHL